MRASKKLQLYYEYTHRRDAKNFNRIFMSCHIRQNINKLKEANLLFRVQKQLLKWVSLTSIPRLLGFTQCEERSHCLAHLNRVEAFINANYQSKLRPIQKSKRDVWSLWPPNKSANT